MKKKSEVLFQRRLIKPFKAAYFFVSLIAVLAVYYRDSFYIAVSKPLLMPLLIGIYYLTSKRFNRYFVASLLATWLANILLLHGSLLFDALGGFMMWVARLIVLGLVGQKVRFAGYTRFLLAGLPFLLLMFFLIDVAYEQIVQHWFIYGLHGLVIFLLGGISLSSFWAKSSTLQTYLLLSTLFFIAAQFSKVLEGHRYSWHHLSSFGMLSFVLAQYFLYQFFVWNERKNRRYMIVNSSRRSSL